MAEEKKPFDKKAYDKQFLREHYKWINLGFNTEKPDDMELYNFVKTNPEKQAPFLKRLIREAMEKITQT